MKYFIIILTTAVLLSCEKQREQVADFIYEKTQISNRITHKYEYNSKGQVIVDHEVKFILRAGIVVDTITSDRLQKYSPTGKLISIFNKGDLSRELKSYDRLDSLTEELELNSFGDTTFLMKIDFENGQEIRRTKRMLQEQFSGDGTKNTGERSYDTIFSLIESSYRDGRLDNYVSKDKNGTVVQETEYVYEGDRTSKILKYKYLGDIKFLSHTTVYSKNGFMGEDFVATKPSGDTVAYKKTIRKNGNSIVLNYSETLLLQKHYDSKGQLIAMVDIDPIAKDRIVATYKYDERGNVIEEIKYIEKLSGLQ